eukprot:PhM_4_TR6146/c0_g1_i1/m.1644
MTTPPSTTLTHDDLMTQLRASAEYATAWDLELWRQHETAKFNKSMKEREHKAIEALEEKIKRLDTEAMRARERRKQELAQMEERVKSDAAAVTRRSELLDARERELTQRQTKLDDDARRHIEESDTRVQRCREEAAHKAELDSRRLSEAKETISKLQTRLAAAEGEHGRLWEHFTAFKQRQVSDGPVAHAVHGARQDLVVLTAQHESTLARLASDHAVEVRKLHQDIRERDERLAYAQSEVRRLMQQQQQQQIITKCHHKQHRDKNHNNKEEEEDGDDDETPPTKQQKSIVMPSELSRLLSERDMLLSTGVYDDDAEVIRILDVRIEDCRKRAIIE